RRSGPPAVRRGRRHRVAGRTRMRGRGVRGIRYARDGIPLGRGRFRYGGRAVRNRLEGRGRLPMNPEPRRTPVAGWIVWSIRVTVTAHLVSVLAQGVLAGMSSTGAAAQLRPDS